MFDFLIDNPSNLMLWVKSFVIFAVIFSIGVLIKKYVAKFIQKALSKIGLSLSNDTINSSTSYIAFWFFLIALYSAFITAPIDHKNALVLKIFYGVFAFSVVVLIAALIAKAFQKAVSEAIGVNIIKFTVIFIGVVLILNQLGVKLTPILTALGIGSLAVALALQDTLGNFFAGMNILLSRQIARGDYIRLDSGQEGTVVEIGWRSCRIREMSNTTISVPNVKITSAIITNFHYNHAEVTATLNCGVAYGSDLEKVEKVAKEAAAEIINASDKGIKTFAPVVLFNQFGESGIKFTLIFRVQDVFSRGRMIHDIMKNLQKKFDKEGIEIPFPQRVIHIDGEIQK